MFLHPNFVILGAIIVGIGSLDYLIDTIKGKVKPNKVSYSLWALASFIAFASEVSQGVGIHALLTFSVGFGPLVIFIASFVNKQAQWKLTRFDIACGALSILGLILWQITKIGNIAIMFSIMADGFASIPTIMKSYRHPHTETAWTYLSSAIGGALTLATITNWDFAYFGYPTYIVIVNSLVSYLICFSPRVNKKKKL